MSKFAPYHETFQGNTFTGYTLGLVTPAGMVPLWVVSHALEGNERTISVFTTSPGEVEQPALAVDVLGENGNASAITRGDNVEVTFNTCTFSATWQPLPGANRESGSLLLAISERHGETLEHLAETRLSASDIIETGESAL